jgi:class 3 adenylate cyclase
VGENSRVENEYIFKLKTLIDIEKELQKSRRWATVLFADLTDSTLYKLLRKPIDAETKIYVHNQTVSQAVVKSGGVVVKYLGDGVMAKFEGEKGEVKAIETAVEIQRAFKEYNQNPTLPEIDRILTKIGINSGEVSFWELEGQKENDPQGTAVDIAARLNALAKPLQILCPSDIKQRCVGRIEGVSFSRCVQRELKGIPSPIEVCEILWQQNEMGINEVVHFSVPDPHIDSLLYSVRDAQGEGNAQKAISDCRFVLERDQRHFIANLTLAQIYLAEDKPQEARTYAERALRSNPLSAIARALVGITPWRENERTGKGPISDETLNTILTEVEIALKLSRETADESAEFIAMNALAYYLAMRYDRNGNPNDLEKALKLCQFLEKKYDWIRLHRLAAFLDTYGTVLMCKGDEQSLKQAKQKFEEASKLNPIAPWPNENLAKLVKLAWKRKIVLQ